MYSDQVWPMQKRCVEEERGWLRLCPIEKQKLTRLETERDHWILRCLEVSKQQLEKFMQVRRGFQLLDKNGQWTNKLALNISQFQKTQDCLQTLPIKWEDNFPLLSPTLLEGFIQGKEKKFPHSTNLEGGSGEK